MQTKKPSRVLQTPRSIEENGDIAVKVSKYESVQGDVRVFMVSSPTDGYHMHGPQSLKEMQIINSNSLSFQAIHLC